MQTLPDRPGGRANAAAACPSLSSAAVAAADPAGMVGRVLAQHEHLAEAMGAVQAAELTGLTAPGGLVVAGMGGSAIGGDLAAAVIGERLQRPVTVARQHSPPAWIGPDTVVLCASYSGETEETLSSFNAAGAAGAQRVTLTTGGTLGEHARAEGVPTIEVPSGMQPRAAVVYMTVGVLGCAAACGAAPRLHPEIESGAGVLGDLARAWGPDAPDYSEAKQIAHALHGRLPAIYGAGPTAAVATRWKAQINENAEWPALAMELPEAAHNEVVAWARGAHALPLAALLLDSPEIHTRVRQRAELLAQEAERAGARVLWIDARGETPFERVMSLVMLGDLVSVYLAVLAGVDPTPVEPIGRLKASLVASLPLGPERSSHLTRSTGE